jgi:putative thioredoxin
MDFWAPWCGPCRSLLPIVTKLAQEYGGQFVLAKINIDEQPDLAGHFGVRSVPTVKLIRHGEVVDEFLGALPENAVRAFIDKHVEKASDRVIAAAAQLREHGDLNGAREQLLAVQASEPGNPKVLVAMAELHLAAGEYLAAEQILAQFEPAARSEPAFLRLASQVEFARVAEKAPPATELDARLTADPRDSEARYLLAAQKVMQGDYPGAMDQLLELVQRDRTYGNDAGRTALLRIFELLEDQELASRYRRRMFNAMH